MSTGTSSAVTTLAPTPAFRRADRRRRLAFYGPAFVAAVAYVDPGNFATNFQAGARHGYLLVWVLVSACAVAMFIQYLSAKTGLATGRDLPTLCRDSFPRPVAVGLWAQAEIVAMATDLAEFVGAAIGLYLLFGVPMLPAALITAVASFAILALQRRGYRPFELAIVFMLGVIALGFAYTVVAVGDQSASDLAAGMLPAFHGTDSVVLAIGIIGATVMPHVIYLHSALTAQRQRPEDPAERRRVLRTLRVDTTLGLSLAGLINLSMLCVAAAVFHGTGGDFDGSLSSAHDGFGRLVGGGAALAFAAALLASGLSSSGVGTYSGQIIMDGFLRMRVPLFLRRAVTMAPALTVLALGVSPDTVLLMSQVVLSFGIPFALVPLVLISRRVDLMGDLVNRAQTTFVGWVAALLVSAINVYLLWQVFSG
ncbi:Nramp family divalent metal transporter [Streptomyces fuscichromogenes]|uniref:Divalent metal cation transporter MntH n=1 Tax=Streptomyces fuscichromogenes TaxID=1324013 RepID=A0A917XK83_9ACTN|nr:Nramp family divalent metal transporter [Streptomyces fuscichromogenes]GGN33917.1 divalent metal cation transporter MntH [Streptomyces fuscichromogenes]